VPMYYLNHSNKKIRPNKKNTRNKKQEYKNPERSRIPNQIKSYAGLAGVALTINVHKRWYQNKCQFLQEARIGHLYTVLMLKVSYLVAHDVNSYTTYISSYLYIMTNSKKCIYPKKMRRKCICFRIN